MKRLIFIFAIIFLISSTSCNKFLDVKPAGEILAEDAIKTPADMQLLLNGCYDVLRSGNFSGMLRGISEIMSDNINGINLSGDYNEYYLRNFTIFNGTTRNFWKDGYLTIYRTNVVLKNLDVIELTEAERNRIKGEALFIRAICHFEILRLFAHPYGYTTDNSHLGIPLRLQPGQEALARSTVQEVYDQIINDLKEAIDLIPLQNGIYATSWSAKGYLAKVYFQMNNFTEAFNYANDVITNGGFTFDPNIMGRFTANGTSEAVFALMSTGTQNNSGSKITDLFNSATRPVLLLSDDLYAAATASPDDERGKKWFIKDPAKTNNEAWSTRYNNLPYFRVPVVHLTELMLIRAESGAQLGNTTVAIDDLNKIRDRAYGVGKNPVAAGTSAFQLIQITRDERRIELATEGNRIHDLKRIGVLENNNLQIRGKVWNCNDMILQFTDSEISANPVLVQNPKGGC